MPKIILQKRLKILQKCHMH